MGKKWSWHEHFFRHHTDVLRWLRAFPPTHYDSQHLRKSGSWIIFIWSAPKGWHFGFASRTSLFGLKFTRITVPAIDTSLLIFVFKSKLGGDWRLWNIRSLSFSINNAAAEENSDLLHFALLTLLWWHSTAAITHFMSSRSVAYFINERGLLNLRLIILVTPCSLALTPKYDCW